MTTQELKNNIEKVLGNSIRCFLPSYWWKKLFHSVADRIDEVEQKIDGIEIPDGVPIVNSESELDKLKLPKGSVASVVTEGYGISQCYIPTEEELRGDFNVLFFKLTRVKSVARTVNNLQKDEVASLTLLGANYLNNNTYMHIAAFNGSVSSMYIYIGNINGELVQGVLSNDASLSNLNKILAENDIRLGFIGIGTSIEDNNIEQQLAILDKVFAINGTSDVYNKNGAWEKLAKTSEIIEDEVVFTVGFDGNGNILLTDEEKEANKKAYSKCSNSDINCKLRWYLTSDAYNIDKVYYSSPQPESVNIEKLLAGKIWISQNIVFRGVDLGEYPAAADFIIFGKYDISFNSIGEAGIIPNLSTGRVNFIYMSGDSVPEYLMKFNKTIYEMWKSTYGRAIPVMVWDADDGIVLLPASIRKIPSGQLIVVVWDNVRVKQYELKSDGSVKLLTTNLMFESEMSDDSYNGVQNRVVKKYIDDAVSNLTQEVIDNEEVTAAALNDLNSRLNNIDNDNVVVTFYLPSGETQTVEEKLKNKSAYDIYLASFDNPPIVRLYNGLQYLNATMYGYDSELGIIVGIIHKADVIRQTLYTIQSDGTISLLESE